MAFKKYPLIGLLLLITVVGSPATADPTSWVCPQTDTLSRASFPDGVLWGTATASYQVEGAVDEGCRGPSLWDVYAKRHPERCNYQDGTVAVDFYHRYKEDVQLMKKLNTNAFRFSIAWPRIFPHGRMEKGISKEGVQFYHNLIDELLANGITPLATVFHWDIPQDLEDEYGGFLSRRIVKDFVEYANFTFHEYGGKVKHWLTFNEPWVYSRAGYDVGKKAPGRCSQYALFDQSLKECLGGQSGFEPYNVSHHLLLAHAESVQEFRKCEKCKGGKIGIAHSPAWLEPDDLKEHTNSEASVKRALDFIFGWHLDPTTFGDYPESMKKYVGNRLPQFTEEEKAKLKGSTDFVGFNYYSSFFAPHFKNPNESEPSWQQDSLVNFEPKNHDSYNIGSKPKTALMAVYAAGLKKLMIHVKENYNNPEIIITENGYGEDLGKDDDSIEVGTADYNRKYYLQRHILAMHEAVCEHGVRLTGYFVWALMDNFEWQDGYKSRFGVYYVDFKNNLTRHQKKSGEWYEKFLSTKTAPTHFKTAEL